MYRVDLYARVRRACRIEGMSSREASQYVADPRPANGDRTDPGLHRALGQVAVPHHTTAVRTAEQ